MTASLNRARETHEIELSDVEWRCEEVWPYKEGEEFVKMLMIFDPRRVIASELWYAQLGGEGGSADRCEPTARGRSSEFDKPTFEQ